MTERTKTLLTERDGAVLRVRFNTPEADNAVGLAVLEDLLTVLDQVNSGSDIRVLTLSGAGADFSAGGDREQFTDLASEDPAGAGIRRLGDLARRVCDALATTTAVTIARLHGRTVGAGLALALHCDLRVGAENSRFRLPELALGLPAAWGGCLPRLLHEVGAARIRELLLTGESFDAVQAERMAVLHRVVPESELDAVVDRWTRPVLRRSASALRVTKAMLNSYASTSRQADATLLDSELLYSVLAADRLSDRR